MNLLEVVPQPLQGRGPIAGGLKDLVDRVGIPALDVRRGQRRHMTPPTPAGTRASGPSRPRARSSGSSRRRRATRVRRPAACGGCAAPPNEMPIEPAPPAKTRPSRGRLGQPVLVADEFQRRLADRIEHVVAAVVQRHEIGFQFDRPRRSPSARRHCGQNHSPHRGYAPFTLVRADADATPADPPGPSAAADTAAREPAGAARRTEASGWPGVRAPVSATRTSAPSTSRSTA